MYGLATADASRLMAVLSRSGVGVRFAEVSGGTEVRISEYRHGRSMLTKVVLVDLDPRRASGIPVIVDESARKAPRAEPAGKYPGRVTEGRVRLLSRPVGRDAR